ncbi:unnamed protein product, partial [Ectocarpus sp. 12 AP-2014]
MYRVFRGYGRTEGLVTRSAPFVAKTLGVFQRGEPDTPSPNYCRNNSPNVPLLPVNAREDDSCTGTFRSTKQYPKQHQHYCTRQLHPNAPSRSSLCGTDCTFAEV